MNLPANAGYLGLIPDLGEDPTCLRATKPMSHNYGAVLQSLGATTTKAPVSPGKTKHAYSRYLNVRFGDNIVQVWPTCLHFFRKKNTQRGLVPSSTVGRPDRGPQGCIISFPGPLMRNQWVWMTNAQTALGAVITQGS